jgi:hypothetical protein
MQELFPNHPGYLVEPMPAVSDEEQRVSKHIAYVVHGKRGDFHLMRNHHNPHLFFALNTRNHVGNIRGYEWFTDKNGFVEPLY